MRTFIAKRLALSIITLIVVSIVVFAVANILPGDIGRTILGPYASNAQVARLDRSLGLDRPLWTQYLDYVGGFVRGNWGTSHLLGAPARSIVLDRLGHSLLLGAFAMVIIVPISIGLGVFSGLKRDKVTDRIISITGLSLIALPEFVSGTFLLVLFAVTLHWFPASSTVPSASFGDIVHQLLLPSIPMMFVLFGYISRMARAGTVEVMGSDYVRTATLKGMTRFRLVFRHVLRNALLPTITVVSAQVGYLIGGLVVVETLFNYPGIGELIFKSAIGHDVPVLESAVLMIAVLYTLSNLGADLLYGILNPRIRVGASE